MKKKQKKDKYYNKNQTSFFFEDYLETNKKNKSLEKKNILQDRIYLLFFLFFSLILIFAVRIINVSLNRKLINLSYPIFVGNNLLSNSRDIMKQFVYDRKVVLIHDNIF